MKHLGHDSPVRDGRRRRLVSLLLFVFLGSTSLPAQEKPSGLLDNLYQLRDTKTYRISSADKTGGNIDWITIAPGETKTLAEISGTGVIRRFYMAPLAADRMRYRKAILRIYWDGEKEPCVEVPIGDFFGSGLGTLRYIHSLVVDVNPGFQDWDFDAMVNYLPMPFEKGARITLENDGRVPELRLWYHFDIEQFPNGKLPPNTGRLHAQWHDAKQMPAAPGGPKNTTLGNALVRNPEGKGNFMILDAEGKGTYVGLFLTVDNVIGGWYGEGDDMIFIDGAKLPTFAGTGHEEVFNSGCCPDKEFFGAYTGFYLIQNSNANFGGKNQMYKFYVNDPVRFEKSIRVTIEHGHANNFENDYTATALWYQQEPHKAFPPMPSAAERLPRWPAEVSQALATELEVSRILARGRARLNPAEAKRADALVAECNRSFRELRHQDYVRAVKELQDLVECLKPAAVPTGN
jgi:hypothetical protein